MRNAEAGPEAPAWVDDWLAGDRRALSRAITILENEGRESPALVKAMQGLLGRAMSVGFTGPPGAGKSTLVNAFVAEQRRRGRTVGVLAVDPSSPVSGGAILGDRIRMTGHSGDDGVFVRSLASRGHLGGLSRSAVRVMDCLDAAGLDIIILETVGAGQSEVEIADIADVKVVVAAPGLGDDVQAIKAGILEIADILLVNKGDHPLSSQTVRHLKSMANMRPADARPPVLKATAVTGQGVEALADAVDEIGRSRRVSAPLARARRLIRRAAVDLTQRRLDRVDDADIEALAQALTTGEKSVEAAAADLLGLAMRETT
ncbi:MAG: methylmalonyl Co-A mutase-associated GTPase MeaB [Minwuia sp.]|uniref:methylmalonyl Co-A mutase-associated GTPase MeaB n=1 Tax=Minwuia sp. TaxID=2493630 RepID=UPI003A86EBE6